MVWSGGIMSHSVKNCFYEPQYIPAVMKNIYHFPIFNTFVCASNGTLNITNGCMHKGVKVQVVETLLPHVMDMFLSV